MTTITITIGPRTETFVLVQTDAPPAYDHGGAIELYDGSFTSPDTGHQIIDRYILVPASALDWQRGRNFSGMHTCTTEELVEPALVLLDEADVARYLWRRLYGNKEE